MHPVPKETSTYERKTASNMLLIFVYERYSRSAVYQLKMHQETCWWGSCHI